MNDLERKIWNGRIKVLREEIHILQNEWESSISDEQRLQLRKRIDRKLNELKSLEVQNSQPIEAILTVAKKKSLGLFAALIVPTGLIVGTINIYFWQNNQLNPIASVTPSTTLQPPNSKYQGASADNNNTNIRLNPNVAAAQDKTLPKENDTDYLQVKFSCEINVGEVIMIVSKSTQVIKWKLTSFNKKGYFLSSAYNQCMRVSKQFQEAQDKKIFDHLLVYEKNNNKIICSRSRTSSKDFCEIELFEIPETVAVEPKFIVKDLDRIRLGELSLPITF